MEIENIIYQVPKAWVFFDHSIVKALTKQEGPNVRWGAE